MESTLYAKQPARREKWGAQISRRLQVERVSKVVSHKRAQKEDTNYVTTIKSLCVFCLRKKSSGIKKQHLRSCQSMFVEKDFWMEAGCCVHSHPTSQVSQRQRNLKHGAWIQVCRVTVGFSRKKSEMLVQEDKEYKDLKQTRRQVREERKKHTQRICRETRGGRGRNHWEQRRRTPDSRQEEDDDDGTPGERLRFRRRSRWFHQSSRQHKSKEDNYKEEWKQLPRTRWEEEVHATATSSTLSLAGKVKSQRRVRGENERKGCSKKCNGHGRDNLRNNYYSYKNNFTRDSQAKREKERERWSLISQRRRKDLTMDDVHAE